MNDTYDQSISSTIYIYTRLIEFSRVSRKLEVGGNFCPLLYYKFDQSDDKIIKRIIY